MEDAQETAEGTSVKCVACGAELPEGAAECSACGMGVEQVTEAPEAAEGEALPTNGNGLLENGAKCPKCDANVPVDCELCPECGEKITPKYKPGYACPVCNSGKYTPESGDLVKCDECGNVYVRADEHEGPLAGWKWKFWLGLTFIAVGDFGFALVSYLHNVARWTFLSDMYLGYGWLDTMLGALGVILFGLGVLLFAWAFKREKTLTCPSCNEVILESEMKPEEIKEAGEEEIEAALGEIEAPVECPNCGEKISIYDAACSNCGTPFAPDDAGKAEGETAPQGAAGEVAGDELPQDKFFEDKMIKELETIPEVMTEDAELEVPASDSEEALILKDLESLESKDKSLEGKECPSCGIMVGRDADECPVCGTKLGGS